MSAAVIQVPALDAALLEFGSRLDDIRQQLYYVDVAILKKESRLFSVSVRANLYVQLAAAVEVLVSSVVNALAAEITAAAVSARDVRLSLFAMSKGGQFASLSNVRGLKNWSRRCEVLEALESHDAVELDGAHVPLDGRTIRPEHFEAVWRVFGLPGNSLPGPSHALALNDLADSRNDVAHGNEPLARVAGRKSSSDMIRFVTRIEEVCLHFYDASLEYLRRDMYRR